MYLPLIQTKCTWSDTVMKNERNDCCLVSIAFDDIVWFFFVFQTETIKEKNANDAIKHKIKYAVNIESKYFWVDTKRWKRVAQSIEIIKHYIFKWKLLNLEQWIAFSSWWLNETNPSKWQTFFMLIDHAICQRLT